MIDPEKRKTVYLLHKSGFGVMKIARDLGIDKKTVKRIIDAKGEMPLSNRKDRIDLDHKQLKELFEECSGMAERMHELLEQRGIDIAYSTLTKRIREQKLRVSEKPRSNIVPDSPGAEYQHDTSPYWVVLGDHKIKIQASLLYYRYSKRRYLQFYPYFRRFQMKVFLHEAFMYFGYTCKAMVIDNTNLAVKSGTGKKAIINDEMLAFSKIYNDFNWIAHGIKHSDRKGGVESGFNYVEKNFFPGRRFSSLEDLNKQALEWCREKDTKDNKKTGLIPVEVFESEKKFMKKLPPQLPAPYIQHHRLVDKYGYISFDGNFYWIPRGTSGDVTVLEYSKSIKIYHKRRMIGEYLFPPFGTKRKRITPDGVSPYYRPAKTTIPTDKEEMELNNLGGDVEQYLKIGIKKYSSNKKYRFIRKVYALHRQLSPSLFQKTISRALKYNVLEDGRLDGIAALIMGMDNYDLPSPDINSDYELRDEYVDAEYSSVPDLERYDNKYRGKHEKEN